MEFLGNVLGASLVLLACLAIVVLLAVAIQLSNLLESLWPTARIVRVRKK